MKYLALSLLSYVAFTSCHTDPQPTIDISSPVPAMEIFAEGVISTGYQERDIAISPDRKVILYTLGFHDQSKRCLISICKTEKGWSDKTVLPFSGKYDDLEPFFSPDGQELYFASNRPLPGEEKQGDYNIWKTSVNNYNWSAPVALDTIINTEGDEFYPAVGRSGNLYFTATRADGIGREDIFVSENIGGRYSQPEPLDTAINSASFEFNAFVNPDESLIVFSSFGRPDGFGGGDLYYSKKNTSGQWSPAVNMGQPINSERLDFCPYIDEVGQNFYFTSNRRDTTNTIYKNASQLLQDVDAPLNGSGNIYRISTRDLFN